MEPYRSNFFNAIDKQEDVEMGRDQNESSQDTEALGRGRCSRQMLRKSPWVLVTLGEG